MKFAINLALCVGYILFFVGLGTADIGETYPESTAKWHLPFVILFAFSVPTILGYLCGREYKQID